MELHLALYVLEVVPADVQVMEMAFLVESLGREFSISLATSTFVRKWCSNKLIGINGDIHAAAINNSIL